MTSPRWENSIPEEMRAWCSHHQIHLSGCQSRSDALLFRCFGGTGEQLHPQPGGGEELLHRLPVLGCQNLGGGHQRGLGVISGSKDAGTGCHHRFARTHIALEQPVHRGIPSQIVADFLHRAKLGIGQRKGEGMKKVVDLHRMHGNRCGGISGGAHRRKRQRKGEQLLKDQPPPGDEHIMAAGREVDVLDGVLQVAELILRLDVGGNGLLQCLQQAGERQAHLVGQKAGVDSGCLGIDRDQLPGLGQGEDQRRVHLPAQQRAGHLAVKDIFLLDPQFIHGEFGVEEGQQQFCAIGVHSPDLKDRKPLADVLFPGFGENHGPDGTGLIGVGMQDGYRFGQVDVIPGIVVDQVAHGVDSQLVQQTCPLFTNSFQELDLCIKADCQARSPPYQFCWLSQSERENRMEAVVAQPLIVPVSLPDHALLLHTAFEHDPAAVWVLYIVDSCDPIGFQLGEGKADHRFQRLRGIALAPPVLPDAVSHLNLINGVVDFLQR